MKELKSWIRFNLTEAAEKGDGLFSKSSGNPTAPHWLGSLLFDLTLRAKTENKKITNQVHSSAGIAIFVSDKNNPTHWVEVKTLRPQLADYFGIGDRRPDLVVRFGHGPKMPRAFRRPVEAVII